MRQTRRGRNLGMLMGVLIVVLTAWSGYAATYTVKLAHVAQPTNPFQKAMEYFAEKVTEKSKGAMEVKIFHSLQLGGSGTM